MNAPALASIISGRIHYRGGAGSTIGQESFEIARHAGGHVLRAFCEMDDIGLLRDVTLSLDPDWRPIDAFCRITRGGVVEAATWFGVEDGAVRVEGVVAGKPIGQTLPTEGRCAYLGLHPLQGDALVVTQRGEDEPGVFRTVQGITNSISPNGDVGLEGVPVAIDVAFVGHEPVIVAAGRFEARRYALRWSPDWPPADVWVRKHDCVFLKMQWSLIDNWYELSELVER